MNFEQKCAIRVSLKNTCHLFGTWQLSKFMYICCWKTTQSYNQLKLYKILKPEQNRRKFTEDILKYIFLNEKHCLFKLIQISLKFVSKGLTDNKPELVHYCDVIIGVIASQITSITIVYSTVYSDADLRKHQSSASLAFVRGILRDRWIPRTNVQ